MDPRTGGHALAGTLLGPRRVVPSVEVWRFRVETKRLSRRAREACTSVRGARPTTPSRRYRRKAPRFWAVVALTRDQRPMAHQERAHCLRIRAPGEGRACDLGWRSCNFEGTQQPAGDEEATSATLLSLERRQGDGRHRAGDARGLPRPTEGRLERGRHRAGTCAREAGDARRASGHIGSWER